MRFCLILIVLVVLIVDVLFIAIIVYFITIISSSSIEIVCRQFYQLTQFYYRRSEVARNILPNHSFDILTDSLFVNVVSIIGPLSFSLNTLKVEVIIDLAS